LFTQILLRLHEAVNNPVQTPDMGIGFRPSRRKLFQLLIGGLSVRRFAAAFPSVTGNQTQRLLEGFRRTATFARRYRVDATVLLCDLPIFTKKNVGGGYASVEASAANGSNAVALQFAAGSWPNHTAGLNRFGILREAVVTRPGDLEFSLDGMITASKEEDLGEAKKALNSSSHTAQVILARAQARNGQILTWTEATEIPLHQTWVEATSLLETLARNEPGAAPRETAVKAVTPFLAAMRNAALSQQGVPVSVRACRKAVHARYAAAGRAA